MNNVLQVIRDLGYTIKDVVMGNCYFLFEGEDDCLCWFHIKEIPRI